MLTESQAWVFFFGTSHDHQEVGISLWSFSTEHIIQFGSGFLTWTGVRRVFFVVVQCCLRLHAHMFILYFAEGGETIRWHDSESGLSTLSEDAQRHCWVQTMCVGTAYIYLPAAIVWLVFKLCVRFWCSLSVSEGSINTINLHLDSWL